VKTIGGVQVDEGRRCEGAVKSGSGRPCRNPASVGSHFCPLHDPEKKRPISRKAAAFERYRELLREPQEGSEGEARP
jgi:hypothetical protein